jgi:hypothetical protein
VTQGNVLRLLELRRKTAAKTKIIVSFIENPLNLDEIEPFQAYWMAQGVDSVVIRRLHSAAGGVATIAAEMLAQQKAVERFPCLYPWERILLNARGELAFCPQDWVHGSVLANYAQQSIREVWQGEAYQSLRRCHQANDFSTHAFCGKCPDWAQTRWPGQGRSYADLVDELNVMIEPVLLGGGKRIFTDDGVGRPLACITHDLRRPKLEKYLDTIYLYYNKLVSFC